MSSAPIKLFTSYAREDEYYKDELQKRLKPYVRNNIIDSWNDRAILPGSTWDDEIKKQMNEADVILFLISADFLASDYINDVEIKKALERYEKGQLRIVPIVLRTSDLSQLKINKFQALPTDAIPITKWDDADEAWMNVISGLKRIFDQDTIKPISEDSKPKIDPINMGSNERKLPKPIIAKIKTLIANGKLESAIKLSMSESDNLDADFQNTIILLSGRYTGLKKEELSGIISNDSAQLKRSQITHGLLELLSYA